jgi:hypothetical protein
VDGEFAIWMAEQAVFLPTTILRDPEENGITANSCHARFGAYV